MAATPALKTCIASYFSRMLDVWTDGPKTGKRNNLKVRVEGEVIISDEFVDLLEKQRRSRRKGKRYNRKEEVISLNVRIAKMPRRVITSNAQWYLFKSTLFSNSGREHLPGVWGQLWWRWSSRCLDWVWYLWALVSLLVRWFWPNAKRM